MYGVISCGRDGRHAGQFFCLTAFLLAYESAAGAPA